MDIGKGLIIARELEGHFSSRKFEKCFDRAEFVNDVTALLGEISKDRHIFLVDRQENIQTAEEKNELKIEVHPHFGYFAFTQFGKSLQGFKPALEQIRTANPKAIILDLRENGGGALHTMAYIASHFIPPNITLGQNTYRDPITEDELQTFPTAPVKTLSEEELPSSERMLDQPIFILTSNDTFSAAEALTYHLREHRKAIVIGETTGGGAHVNKLFEVNTDFYLALSFGDYVLKKGEKNWDGVGLVPDLHANAARGPPNS